MVESPLYSSPAVMLPQYCFPFSIIALLLDTFVSKALLLLSQKRNQWDIVALLDFIAPQEPSIWFPALLGLSTQLMVTQKLMTDITSLMFYIFKTMEWKYKHFTKSYLNNCFFISFQQMRWVDGALSCCRGGFHRGLSGLFAWSLLCWSWPFFPIWALQPRILLHTGVYNSSSLG